MFIVIGSSLSYVKNPIQNEAQYYALAHTLSGIFHCVSAAELFEQHETQFGMWL